MNTAQFSPLKSRTALCRTGGPQECQHTTSHRVIQLTYSLLCAHIHKKQQCSLGSALYLQQGQRAPVQSITEFKPESRV